MSPEEIKHFLVTRNVSTGEVTVEEFGTDYDAAHIAYSEAERASVNSDLDIVLLSADSLETLEETHSSYLRAGEGRLAQLLSTF